MNVPYDTAKLNVLMDKAGLDIAVACTRHNVRYLSGGYFYHFHENSTRMGQSQYLPFIGIVRNSPQDTFYIHRPDEGGQIGTANLWFPNLLGALRGTLTSAAGLSGRIRSLGLVKGRIGLEMPFIPSDAFLLLRRELPEAEFIDVTEVFEELRTIKNARELDIMRSAYARLADAIHATFMASKVGDTTKDIEQRVRIEMTNRGLGFLFALVCAGPGFLRAPSSTRWEEGRILHIDAGGADGDYIADICRMGCLGEPGPLARELHLACIEVQNRVRSAIMPGISCRDVMAIGMDASKHYGFSRYARFVVHGIGMVPYEQPLFNPPNDRPLEEGMVISIETDFIHPEVGHVKIEDAVAVTSAGCEGFGDRGRDWTIRGMD